LQIDLHKYTEFVEAITSKESNDLTSFMNSLDRLDANYDDNTNTHGPDVNVPLLLTSAMGMSGEAGEFSEIFKKVIFHSKPYTEETKAHAAKELGDVIWYWTNACRALGLDPNQVIADNVTKLEARYPGGKFSAAAAEFRAVGDI
jgi:NTP pyrophosphatase (non-canonical NTP hydrolase)